MTVVSCFDVNSAWIQNVNHSPSQSLRYPCPAEWENKDSVSTWEFLGQKTEHGQLPLKLIHINFASRRRARWITSSRYNCFEHEHGVQNTSHLFMAKIIGTANLTCSPLCPVLNWLLSKQGICWPVPHAHITGSSVELLEVTFFEVDLLPSAGFRLDRDLKCYVNLL